MKIAVLGANGQVGSEICLLLRGVPGMQVVPICRNHSGSAFLRWHGMSCRHGRASDPVESRALLGDCDVVVNFALATGRPREAREANRRLVEAAARDSLPGARIIFFSTLAVYPQFLAAGAPSGLTAYGKEKLRGERDALQVGQGTGKATWVLRLGHVYGELQGIREEVRRVVSAGPVRVPRYGQLGSNVVHTVTIVDAILKIVAGGERPGVYDLLSSPPWSWEQVLVHEAGVAGVPLVIEEPHPDPLSTAARGWSAQLSGSARSVAAAILGSPRTREIGLNWITHLPEPVNLRLQSRNFQRRAAAEIAGLSYRPVSHAAFTIPSITPKSLVTLSPTEDLLCSGWGAVPAAGQPTFAPDLP